MTTYTREQLIGGMQKANQQYLENPKGYDKITLTKKCAETQIDDILKNVK